MIFIRLLRVLASTGLILLVALQGCGQLAMSQPYSLYIPDFDGGVRRLVTSEDLITLREVGGMVGSGLSVSPDGRYLAFEAHQAEVALNNYHVAWFVAPTSTKSTPIMVDDGGDPTLFRSVLPDGRLVGSWIAEYAKWAPDSRGIAYRKKVGGETQIWWSSLDGKETRQLTHSPADVETFYWSRDGSHIYFSTDADRTELHDVGETRYRAGHVFDYDKDWSATDGKPYYPPYSLTDGKPRIRVLDIASRVERFANDEDIAEYERLAHPDGQHTAPRRARTAVLADDGNGVGWVQPDDPDKQGWSPPLTVYASLAADGSDAVRCPATECTGILDLAELLRDGLHWTGMDNEILFVRKEGMGYSKRSLYGWRIGEKHVRKILSTDEWITDCSIVQGRAICFRESPRYPRTIISIALADGSMETLVDPNPEFRNLIIGDVELFEWTNSLGCGTFGYLVKPPDYVSGRHYPLVLVGYRARTALRGGVGDEYPVHLLAANGFVVLVYDKPTPHEAYEVYTDPIAIAKARWGPDLFELRMPLASFQSAIRRLTERGLVDPTQVALTGLSAGVTDVNYALIHSDLFVTAITSSSEFSPSDYFLRGISGEAARKHRTVIRAGRYDSPNGFLRQQLSLALNAQRVTAPILINAGDEEHPAALEDVITLIENDKPVEMVVHPDEGHIKWQPAHRYNIYRRNVQWFKFWLQGAEEADPVDPDQYERWRELRSKRNASLDAAN